MKVKIDTKEKFHVIYIQEPIVSANMTVDLELLFRNCWQNEVKHIILNLREVRTMDRDSAVFLVRMQQEAYDNNLSFVLCEVNKDMQASLDAETLLELMNITPTESEAWDIVQMEEIEREFLD